MRFSQSTHLLMLLPLETLTSNIMTGLLNSNTGSFSHQWSLLGARTLAPKNFKKQVFFQNNFNPLKAHTHYFIVLIYLATWRAAKLGIFTHFMFKNLTWCSQSINSLIYVHSIQIPCCFLGVTTVAITPCRTTAALLAPTQKKKFHFSPYTKKAIL